VYIYNWFDTQVFSFLSPLKSKTPGMSERHYYFAVHEIAFLHNVKQNAQILDVLAKQQRTYKKNMSATMRALSMLEATFVNSFQIPHAMIATDFKQLVTLEYMRSQYIAGIH
jgi:hypothetical protein